MSNADRRAKKEPWLFRATALLGFDQVADYRPLLKLSLMSSRAMIIRRISEVPAPISHSF
jgi:hypothetical protein